MKEVDEVWWENGEITYRRVPNNPDRRFESRVPTETFRGNLETAIKLALKHDSILHIGGRFVVNFTDPRLNEIYDNRVKELIP